MDAESDAIEGLLRRVSALEAELASCRRDEAKVRWIAQRWQRLLEASADGCWVVDAGGLTIFANEVTAKTLGRTMVELAGKPLATMARGEWQGALEECMECVRRGERSSREVCFTAGDGTKRWALLSVSPDLDGAGRFVGALGVITDVTEEKRLEERLRGAQRLATAGRLAAQLAHDSNNLLSIWTGYLDLIRRQLPSGHPGLAYCEEVQQAALQMAEINSDILVLGHRGRVDPHPVDLNRIIRRAVGRMPPSPRRLKVEIDLAPDLMPVGGAPAQLQRLVSKLVTNARESMRDRGKLTLKTENVHLDRPSGEVSSIEVGEYVRLTVRDTGCGIPEGVRERIFDPFFTTETVGEGCGFGLGLSVVQAIVEDHGGAIDLESEVGKGTTFTIYLPVFQPT